MYKIQGNSLLPFCKWPRIVKLLYIPVHYFYTVRVVVG